MSIQKPINIQQFKLALNDISDSHLYQLKKELSHSLTKLRKTNNKLSALIHKVDIECSDGSSDDEFEDFNAEDETLFREIIQENEVVSRNQEERIEILNDELSRRGLPKKEGVIKSHNLGEKGIAHSAIDDNSTGSKKASIDTDNSNGDNNAPNSLIL